MLRRIDLREDERLLMRNRNLENNTGAVLESNMDERSNNDQTTMISEIRNTLCIYVSRLFFNSEALKRVLATDE